MAEGVGIAARLDGQRILLTGVTGFVGEALLHLLLSEVPGVHARRCWSGPRGPPPAPTGSPRCSSKPIFADRRRGGRRRRRADGGPGPGARGRPRRRARRCPTDLDAVVHCAGDVSFDPPVDEGFRTNVVGTRELLARIARRGRRRTSTTSTSPRRTSPGAAAAASPRPRSTTTSTSRPSCAGASAQRRGVEDRPAAPTCSTKLRAKAEKDARPGRAARPRPRRPRRRRKQWVDGRAGPDRHRAGPQPRLDRLLHVHQGARRARRRGARRATAADHDRPAEHHRVRARAAAPGLDRGLQDGRAADPGLRPRRAARVPGRRRHHRRHRPGRPRRRRDRRGARAPAGGRRRRRTSTSLAATATR